MGKRFIWKTIKFNNSWETSQIESAYQSSRNALGLNRGKTFVFTKAAGGCEIETDVPWSELKALFRSAGVRIPWKNGVLYDTQPSWETYGKDA